MARLDDYDWKNLPPDLVEWLITCTDIINLGKYSARSLTTIPTAATLGFAGEFGIAKDGVNWFVYFIRMILINGRRYN